jgi:hypothetical protein
VNVWFNQLTQPTGTTPPDFEFITNAASGSFTLSTASTPPLLKGQTYYIGVENPCINGTNVTVSLRVDFGINLITLTNMVAYTNVNAGFSSLLNDYYKFVVPTNAARAQFEIDNPSGDMTLAIRKGLPLPDTGNYGLISANPGLNDELIIVFTNSTPVPLTPGNWYLTAINVSGAPVLYSIMASWWPTTGRPIGITGEFLSSSNSFCITWASLPDVHYFIQGVTNLGPGMTWTTLVADVLGAPDPATNTTYCLPLPSPFHFFRVGEGQIPAIPPPPVATVSFTGTGFLVQWTGPIYAQYLVQWTPSLAAGWNTLPMIFTSYTGQFSFFDDGTLTGGLGGMRFYRIQVLR